jgi:hypothetical protein
MGGDFWRISVTSCTENFWRVSVTWCTENFWGVSVTRRIENIVSGKSLPVHKAYNLTEICKPIIWKVWDPQPLTTL